MKSLRRRCERFFLTHSDKGVPNLMLFVAIGNAIVYLFTRIDPSNVIYNALCFSRAKILRGQVWRLVTYIFIPDTGNSGAVGVLLLALMLYFYYFIGRVIEGRWGSLKFTVYYFFGVVLTDAFAMIFGVTATTYYLDLSLILAYATLYPENRVLFMMIIPLKIKFLAWLYFAFVIYEFVAYSWPWNCFPLVALLNYFLFFGADIVDVLPAFLQRSGKRGTSGPYAPAGTAAKKKTDGRGNREWASAYASSDGKKPYHHKCTICGKTDTEYPDLEFRYCSKCRGYYCYCQEHISTHVHITDEPGE